MAGAQLPCLGIACDRRVAHVHHRVLDISVPQPILHKRDIRASVQQMHHNRVAQRMKPRFRTTHVSLSNFWVPLQSLCKGGDYATLVPP